MIRLATIHGASAVGRSGVRGLLSKARLASPASSIATTRSFADDAEKPKGVAYSKLTLGIPKENYPRERRVAATPEVSVFITLTRVMP